MKKNNILTLLLLVFVILFLLYPTSYGIYNIKSIFLFLILFSILCCLIKKAKFRINEKYYILIIIILAIMSRIGIVLIFNSFISQVSDFGDAINASKTLIFSSSYHRIFTHWILWPSLINPLYKIFGNSQLVALLVNAIILILTSMLLYKIGSLLFNKRKYGFYASLLYIIWPANILYTLIFTQEHLCQLLLLLIIYLFLLQETRNLSNKNKFKSIILYVIIGILLGLSTFFKNFAPVFIIAFIIYYILYFLKNKIKKSELKWRAISIIIICLAFFASKNLIFIGIDKLAGVKVARNITPCYLNVGLRDKGVYNKINYEMYFNTAEQYNYDFNKTNKKIMKDLINYYKNKENSLSITELLDYKAKIIFGGDSARLLWVTKSFEVGEHYRIINIINKYIVPLNETFFIVLVFLVSIGIKDILIKKDLKIFLLYLTFYGSLLLLILVEAQNRYMYAVQPILCILAIQGLYYIKNLINTMREKIKESGELNNEKILEITKS